MNTNTTLGTPVNIIREMNIYDALPEDIQQIIRDQPFDLHVEPIARFYLELKRRKLSDQYIKFEIRNLCIDICKEF